MIVVGSYALQIGLEHLSRGLGRVPTDLDILATKEEASDFISKANLSLVKMSPSKVLAKALDGEMVELEYITPETSARLGASTCQTKTSGIFRSARKNTTITFSRLRSRRNSRGTTASS